MYPILNLAELECGHHLPVVAAIFNLIQKVDHGMILRVADLPACDGLLAHEID